MVELEADIALVLLQRLDEVVFENGEIWSYIHIKIFNEKNFGLSAEVVLTL